MQSLRLNTVWSITEDSFDIRKQQHMETVFTIGNGYLSTRGAHEETYPGNRRATFVHGIFDDVPIVFTELANTPDWLPLGIYVDGERFNMESGTIRSYNRHLDLKTGLLTRTVYWISPAGKGIHLTFERFASLEDDHLLCLRCHAIPEFDGVLEFRISLNGNTENEGFIHWRWVNQKQAEDELVTLHSRTRTTGIDLGLAMRIEASRAPHSGVYCDVENIPTRTLTFNVSRGESIIVDKFVGIASSRDTLDPAKLAEEHARGCPGWERAFEVHQTACEKQWERMDVVIEGDDEAQLAVRFSLYQLFIAGPRHDDRVNIGAKTLSGFGYRGHSFWDTELFMLPVFIFTSPEIARNLLDYRYQRLPAARKKASLNGYEGAQFPWESADTGDEVTPTWVPNYSDHSQLDRIWTGDIEIHISADIAYAAHLYWTVTGDDDWLINKGAELIVDTAKFWSSRAEWDDGSKTYQYTRVIGPDEYHEHVDNNYFTNYMARWNLLTAFKVLSWLRQASPAKADELVAKLDLTDDRLKTWQKVIQSMYLPVQPNRLIEQFEGYFQRKDIDLASLEPREVSVPATLGAAACTQSQAIKQPDVLMLMYLLPEDFTREQIRVNYDYYTPRTDLTFGSSLGPSIQAIMACKLGESQSAFENFTRAARADLHDVRGNAGDGIHGASAGGIWQAVVFGFAGLKLTGDKWEVNPSLPINWKRLRFHFTQRGEKITVDIKN